MGRTCSTHGRDEKFIHTFGCKTWLEETTLGDLGRDGKIILQWEAVDWMHLAQY
jgi:hypothetical protein